MTMQQALRSCITSCWSAKPTRALDDWKSSILLTWSSQSYPSCIYHFRKDGQWWQWRCIGNMAMKLTSTILSHSWRGKQKFSWEALVDTRAYNSIRFFKIPFLCGMLIMQPSTQSRIATSFWIWTSVNAVGQFFKPIYASVACVLWRRVTPERTATQGGSVEFVMKPIQQLCMEQRVQSPTTHLLKMMSSVFFLCTCGIMNFLKRKWLCTPWWTTAVQVHYRHSLGDVMNTNCQSHHFQSDNS